MAHGIDEKDDVFFHDGVRVTFSSCLGIADAWASSRSPTTCKDRKGDGDSLAFAFSSKDKAPVASDESHSRSEGSGSLVPSLPSFPRQRPRFSSKCRVIHNPDENP
jgi:hypothetical protein